ncbi:hypothetical protein HHK36_031105 [Tetracentron sinense]|uniref:Uncharacterized protein n=1 Tax=Tetracentron sinense TaxID=13715 RepID=A0A834Y903_TETSI|nr:hypothetical protein HHK36_031105 [Tetracentron sinense]
MEKKSQKKQGKKEEEAQKQPPHISPMEPVTRGAYGGGLYGTEEGQPEKPEKQRASDTQSADGPVGPTIEPKHKPPPSTGDRDIDITGQSYIQRKEEEIATTTHQRGSKEKGRRNSHNGIPKRKPGERKKKLGQGKKWNKLEDDKRRK